MPILLVGLSHRTAPVEMREQLALTGDGLRLALKELHAQGWPCQPAEAQEARPPLLEGAILSTCNRLEIYGVGEDMGEGKAAIETFLARMFGLPPDELHPCLYVLEERGAVEHLMRVAAGLDSMILGEPQILGQVSQAFGKARRVGTAGPILSRLFSQAVHAGKRAHGETAISRHTTSVSHAAVLLAQEKVGDLTRTQALVIGAGEMAEKAAHALQGHGVPSIACINRTHARAEAIAQQVGGQALNWYHLPGALARADLVISATSAPHTVIHPAGVMQILPERAGRPLTFVDIAVPRDVDEAVGNLPGVHLYDIDDLRPTLDNNLAQREAAVPQVEAIIGEEAAAFEEWLQSREVVPTITALRRKVEALAEAELERTLQRLNGLGPEDRQIVARLARRIVNKLLHDPTVRLKACADGDRQREAYVHAVRDLFALDESMEDG